jgi:hypothetical protein
MKWQYPRATPNSFPVETMASSTGQSSTNALLQD